MIILLNYNHLMYSSLQEIIEKFHYSVESGIKPETQQKILNIFNNHRACDYLNDVEMYIWIGRYYLSVQNNTFTALKYFLLAFENNNVVVCTDLVKYYIVNFPNFDKALKYLICTIEKNHPNSFKNLMQLYLRFDKSNQELFEKCIELEEKTNNKYLSYNIAKYYHNTNQYEKAAHYYNKAAREGMVKAHLRLATYNGYVKNNVALAILHFLISYINDVPDTLFALTKYIFDKFQGQQIDIMIKKFITYLNKKPNNNLSKFHYFVGVRYNKINEYDLAIEHLIISTQLDSKEQEYPFLVALLYKTKKNDFENAEKFYKVALERNHPEAAHYLGLLYYKQEKFTDAINVFRKSINEYNYNSNFELSKCYYEIEDYENADILYKTALELKKKKNVNLSNHD